MPYPIDYTQYETAAAIPEASSMIETFRAIGYNIETAVADIIDNSVSASAKNIWVTFDWKGADTWLTIKDDGIGMNNEELIMAMRPGSKNPLAVRNSKDLGRFGLGLKTASFSQARQLTVLSKKQFDSCVYWTWDLNYVNQTGNWNLIKFLPGKFTCKELQDLNSGTIVIWNDIDRLVKDLNKDDNNAFNKFMQIMLQVKKHLAMVFHRFIEDNRIKIFFQGRPVEAWNPFMLSEIATQGFAKESLHNAKAFVKGYVLPHKSKISIDKFNEGEGPKGWNEQQGFYIYRNDRLLLAGDWLGMFRKEEHYKLARIEINLPNSFDSEWQIDIKKSIARPPLILKDRLKSYALEVRKIAVSVFRARGATINPLIGQKIISLWLEHKRNGKWFYKINREHPLIERIKLQTNSRPDKAIEILLKLIEETIPVKSIYIKEAEESETQGRPFESVNHEELKKLIKQVYDTLLIEGKNDIEAKGILQNLEPFNYFPEYIATITK